MICISLDEYVLVWTSKVWGGLALLRADCEARRSVRLGAHMLLEQVAGDAFLVDM